jgi:hypothetical protein
MALEVLRITTIGTEVYETETGPTIGYDNIETYFAILPEDWDGDYFEPEDTRSIERVCTIETLGM